jgi:hypothetical protein
LILVSCFLLFLSSLCSYSRLSIVLSYSDIFCHLLIRLYYSLPVFCNYFLVFSVLILLSSRLLFVSLPGSCLLCAPLLVCLPCVSLLVLCLLGVLEKRDSSGNLFPSTRILKLADLSRGSRLAGGLLRNHSTYIRGICAYILLKHS